MAAVLRPSKCLRGSQMASSSARKPGTKLSLRRSQVVHAKQARFDEGSAEVRRIVNRDLKSTGDDVAAMKKSNAGPKSLDELENIFATSNIEDITTPTQSSPSSGDAGKTAPARPVSSSGATKPASPFGSASAKASTSPFGSASAKATSSPFGAPSAPSAAASPFGKPAGSKPASPFGATSGIQEPKGLSPNMQPDPVEEQPWWSFLNNLKTAQIVTVISFTLIINLMLATFKIVLDSGAIHFNE